MNQQIVSTPTENAAILLAAEEHALALARMGAQVKRIDGGRPYRVLPDGRIESLEGFQLAPSFRRGDVEVHDGDSFIEYVARFKDSTSVVFADKIKKQFTAVLDYHEAGAEGKAHWARHRVVLPLRHTEAWTTWTAADKKPMAQAEFARFIEDNIPDVALPVGADIVSIARTLEAKKSVTFESAIREQDGAHKFAYHEDVQGSAKNGTVSIPDEFILALRPFEGSARPWKVTARFRYRLQPGGKLELYFDLYRLSEVIEEAFLDERQKIEDALTDTLTLSGPAPAKLTAE